MMAFKRNILNDTTLETIIYVPKHQISLEMGYADGMPAH